MTEEFYVGGHPYRTACDILRELRSCHKVRNYANLMGLVEELQSTFNRMEAACDLRDSTIRTILKRLRKR